MKKIIIFLYVLFSIPISAQWVQQNSGTSQDLKDVYCITENIVITVGNAGTLLKTIDGGENWSVINSGTTSNLEKVQFVSPIVGYATGTNGIILKTSNGGANWSVINSGTTSSLYGLSCLNENIFSVAGENGVIKKTIDGGATFVTQNSTSSQTILDIQYLNEQTSYALVGSYNDLFQDKILFKTIDGGISWSILISESVDAFYFLNENIGFINKSNNGLYKTSNGGLNLSFLSYSNILETDIFSLNESLVWDVGENPALCNCTLYCISKRSNIDQNANLEQINNCYDSNNSFYLFNAIHFANETNGYVVGANGTIFRNSTGINEPYLSTNKIDIQANIKIYPNPASDQINIAVNEKSSEPFTIEITDFLGKKVFSQSYNGNNTLSIDSKNFSKGVYLVRVISQDKRETQKVVIK
jgi:Secretion system C-terminal sorting domain/Photosynthesis system II assembly factor YCF48